MTNTVCLMLRAEGIDMDLASPNFVADFARARGLALTSDQVVAISDAYAG